MVHRIKQRHKGDTDFMFVPTVDTFQTKVVLVSSYEDRNLTIDYVRGHKIYSSKNSQISHF